LGAGKLTCTKIGKKVPDQSPPEIASWVPLCQGGNINAGFVKDYCEHRAQAKNSEDLHHGLEQFIAILCQHIAPNYYP